MNVSPKYSGKRDRTMVRFITGLARSIPTWVSATDAGRTRTPQARPARLFIRCAATGLALFLPLLAKAASMAAVEEQIASHPGATGVYVLERGEEALIARAWLADHAEQSIEVQYFIWSSDNIGTLAAEAVLRAADRGVQVRIIVDDMLVDAPDKTLLALAQHPNIDIRIYNPTLSVGVPLYKKLLNAAKDFRGFNQRMHDKTFVVDGKVAVTGGRNMSSEYYDYNHEYNFRDRDVLLVGEAVNQMRASFANFHDSDLAVPVAELYGAGLTKKVARVSPADVRQAYAGLHAYAQSTENFAPNVRAAIDAVPTRFTQIAEQMVWGRVDFISDAPGKNSGHSGLGGGGLSSQALAQLIAQARSQIVIQSPYLVLSDEAIALLEDARNRGVRIRINTNSLASTDNLPAFGGYQSQRKELIRLGVELFEYRPDAEAHRRVLEEELAGLNAASKSDYRLPTFGLHAKTMVVDDRVVFIGTYNLDPRSQNLNTEVGALVHSSRIAQQVRAAIEIDMQPENSWRGDDDPDEQASWWKRTRARLWRLAPLKPLL